MFTTKNEAHNLLISFLLTLMSTKLLSNARNITHRIRINGSLGIHLGHLLTNTYRA